MFLKPSVSKQICTCIGVFCASVIITMMVSSIFMKIYSINKLRKLAIAYYNDETNDKSSYDDCFIAEYKATFEFVDNNWDNIIYTKKRVEQLNTEQHIYNMEKFGPVRPTTIILVIQVHDNTAVLKVLLASLKKVYGIANSLLIFCHDYYDKNINEIIHGIRFTKYMQVFYPYSSQIYPRVFPGSDNKFCSDDFNCTDLYTESKECLRKPFLVQQKHFWWWHVNYVFDHLTVIKNFTDPIVFLEDNQYVMEDILYMLKVLENLMPEYCPQCEVISLGAHAPVISLYNVLNSKIIIEPWDPVLLNIGLAFNRTVWTTIKSISFHFCHFDDYRWDASLYYLASQRSEGPLMVLAIETPRVLRIELCDASTTNCTLVKNIEITKKFVKSVRKRLYPQSLILSNTDKEPAEVISAGEWKDVRDSALCMYFVAE